MASAAAFPRTAYLHFRFPSHRLPPLPLPRIASVFLRLGLTPPPYHRMATPAAAKAAAVAALLATRRASGKTLSQLGAETTLGAIPVGQILCRQAPLPAGAATDRLRAALPGLTDEQVAGMQAIPDRSYDPSLAQEPAVWRLLEAVHHHGGTFNTVLREDFGDGIMSAIDFHMSVEERKGASGERRVVVTLDGKFLPYTPATPKA